MDNNAAILANGNNGDNNAINANASSEVADEIVNSLCVNGLTSAQLLGFLSSASMARVTSTLSIAAAASLESLAEEVGSVIRKRRKLHAESDAATQRSTVQVEAIINQSVKNFYSPGDDSIDGKDKRRSDGGPGPKTASKSKSPESVADWSQCFLRFALLVAGTVEPKTLSPVDILACGSRILSLVRSMPISTILIYDDCYRRGIAPLIAGGTDLTLRQCYLSDSNPALLAEVVSYLVRSTSARRGTGGSSSSSRIAAAAIPSTGRPAGTLPEAPAMGR
ncbi:hypothetical protein FOZ60_004971 [Perkinsus olseni]|uniref:Uncharacterized protein n=1 Tax=Perkinsus olseni TaxID=32597 RepID=A0A7J6S5J5_PEROL|nr:hypothetical protein FOZ60_004971 [Perkinsus olseni]KAF4728023.1 hypothetical protein FOZ62_002570 [Perkinsus olseni]